MDREDDRDPKTRAAQIISKLDLDGDQKVSKDEFMLG